MPARKRWTNVRGTDNRIHDPLERLLVGALDLPGRGLAALGRALGRGPTGESLRAEDVREVLVLRLDRIGDVVMSLPMLADLRRALPAARIRLAVGRWSEDVARSAPVDEVIVWSAPWVGRRSEGADSFAALAGQALGLRRAGLDLAIDLQGDIRAALLMRLTGARARVGYANTGGAWMLSHVVPLDEDVSWVEQNRLALAVALGPQPRGRLADPLTAPERTAAAELLARLGLPEGVPRIGVHPAGGRLVKQWPAARWAAVAARLQHEFGARVLITGSGADAALAADVAARLPERPTDLAGRLSVRETLAVIEQLDLYLSPDTGTMHLACLVGTPTVSVFGPSDPGRYFSGADFDPAEAARHVVMRPDLWCAPCNLIRKPPAECAQAALPECLELVSAEEVHAAAARLLVAGGFAPRA
ncbi:MAG: glycosyltransferase family 9 protein [Vicinamibacteria bacterium]|nr:glycosyltransferase family 9 protein [Vicinamibacteria bacterium]